MGEVATRQPVVSASQSSLRGGTWPARAPRSRLGGCRAYPRFLPWPNTAISFDTNSMCSRRLISYRTHQESAMIAAANNLWRD